VSRVDLGEKQKEEEEEKKKLVHAGKPVDWGRKLQGGDQETGKKEEYSLWSDHGLSACMTFCHFFDR
jgi:hypothetical protein